MLGNDRVRSKHLSLLFAEVAPVTQGSKKRTVMLTRVNVMAEDY